MQLRWRQTQFTWIAIDPKSDDFRGSDIEKPVHDFIKELCSHLIEIGGKIVVVEFHEPPELCKALVEFGEIVSSDNLELFKGEDRECHTNSAVLWSQNKEDNFLFTGFALSEDDVWRRHSWVKKKDDKLIETTIRREKYYGLILPKELAESFLEIYH